MTRVVFRVDASREIGTGHVMRCLTLADAIEATGGECHFICREHPGNMIDVIRGKGYRVDVLPSSGVGGPHHSSAPGMTGPDYSSWLGATQEQDAVTTAAYLAPDVVDWLVVDHYALDARWECMLKPHYRRLMVIDDLADRNHHCDLLLDQTYGRNPQDYQTWISGNCILLCGADYALLRAEFESLRPYSLERRNRLSRLDQLLVSMGGVDKCNLTGDVLQAIEASELPNNFGITVVMGEGAPWLDSVRRQVECMSHTTELRVGVSDMAELMAMSDLAIGAAGTSSWERCCVGLPTVMVVAAENQAGVAAGLQEAGAALLIKDSRRIMSELPGLLKALSSPQYLRSLAAAAGRIIDGKGAARVMRHLVN